MIKRKLEKEVEVTAEGYQNLSEFPIKLEYYLLESETDEIDDLRGKKIFGIEVVKKMQGIEDEIKSYKDISCCEESTQNILNKLAINSVTPLGLPYVLDDLIGI
jgi:Family of unknown function (DUF6514)